MPLRMGSGMIGAGTAERRPSSKALLRRQPSVQGDRGMLAPVMSYETAYRSSPSHWKRYAVRVVSSIGLPFLRSRLRLRDWALSQQGPGPREEVIAVGGNLLHGRPDVEAILSVLRLERTDLHPEMPARRRGKGRQTRIVRSGRSRPSRPAVECRSAFASSLLSVPSAPPRDAQAGRSYQCRPSPPRARRPRSRWDWEPPRSRPQVLRP